ncbi:hypothetical protein SAMN05444397_11157 [Flavobacterium aquidurense]|nr:hypothetical protein SAMN05444397_11157 [Flavobacterium aquidurense]
MKKNRKKQLNTKTMSDFLNQFGEDLEKNVPGFIAVSIAEIQSGMSYFSLSVVPEFDPELASAFNLEVVKAKMNAISALGLKNQIVSDIMITLSSQIHIIDISDNNMYMIYLAVDSTKANLGMTKSILNKYKKEIASKL